MTTHGINIAPVHLELEACPVPVKIDHIPLPLTAYSDELVRSVAKELFQTHFAHGGAEVRLKTEVIKAFCDKLTDDDFEMVCQA